MLWMCVLYVSFGSKVRPITFGCVAMGSALLCIFRSRLLIYSAGSGMNKLFCLDLVWDCLVVYISWLHLCVDVMVMSSV